MCGSPRRRRLRKMLKDLQLGHPGEFNIDLCLRCGGQYLNPQPVGKTLAAYYQSNGERSYPDNEPRGAKELAPVLRWALHQQRGYPRPNCDPPTAWERIKRSKILERTNDTHRYIPFEAPGRLLDIGCGSGRYLATMRELGWQPEGLTMVAEQGNALEDQMGIPVLEGSIQDLPDDREYDAITLWHVLEHLPDPTWDLARIRRHLKPGGRLAIGVPVMDSFEAETLGPQWMGFEVPRHLLFFTRERLRQLLEETGFIVEGVFSEVRFKSFKMSVDRAELPWRYRKLKTSRRALKRFVRQLAREHRNGTVVAWARSP